MDVSSITTAQPATAAGGANGFKQVAADFKSLAQALQSGDLAGAQQAFATLQQDSPRVAQAVSGAASNSASDPATSPLQALSKALQSGDLAGAQQAFAALEKAKGGHHGHHHHAPSSAASPTTAVGTSVTSASAGTNVNTVA